MSRRSLVFAALAATAACFDSAAPTGQARVLLSPLLDSLFVGDTQTPPLRVTFVGARGDTQPAGRVRWESSQSAVARVDSTGRVIGAGAGEAIISATANGVTGRALVIVTPTFGVTLLLDTIYLMPGDTITAPAQVRRKGGGAPPPWFEAPTQAVFTIDSASGRVTATAAGGPITFVVRADTVADSGAVHVRVLSDTTGGRAYFTIFGTVIRRLGAPIRALNYRLSTDGRAFRINVSVLSGNVPVENVIVTLRDSVVAPGVFFVDSISPNEALGVGADFVCRPSRPWAIWGSGLFTPPINALSRRGGSLAITQVDSVPGGLAISGRFSFLAQRMDFYDDPGALLPIRGTFVAPLIRNLNTCQ